ncbi:LysR family transcriptional regulator [Paracidovorax sp. MALMAid1276]|uniref:LysR family transcriptional regulator n=1 Tax=Paracidovorax sp. MALMAid1276 TaxID=3411631 RepID=UPI003B9B9A7D
MNTDSLHLFVAVARRGSFAAVAKELDVDPSSVSRAIADLETGLGLRLLQRSTRSMTLTEAGEIYLSRLEPLLDELEHARDAAAQVSRAPQGVLRLTASVTFGQVCIIPLLGEFHARFPGLQVECLFTDTNVDLVAERVDLAVRLAPTIEGDVVVSKLMDTRYGVYASPGYAERHPPVVRPADLSQHPVLRFNLRAYRTHWTFRDPEGNEERIAIQGHLTLAPASALLAAAVAGLGPALLPDWLVADAVATGRLVPLLPGYAATATTFDTAAWLVYPSRTYLPSKVRAMADFLREKLREGAGVHAHGPARGAA